MVLTLGFGAHARRSGGHPSYRTHQLTNGPGAVFNSFRRLCNASGIEQQR